MTSRRFRAQFRPSIDYLDRRVVPSDLVFAPCPDLTCDTSTNTSTTATTSGSTTVWPSPLIVSGPDSPV
jgi:hypothetical protein